MRDFSQQETGPSASGMLLVLIFIVTATVSGWGFFEWDRLMLMLAALGMAVWLHARPCPRLPSAEPILTAMVIAFAAMTCFLQTGLHETQVSGELPGSLLKYQVLGGFGAAIHVLAAVATFLALTCLVRARGEPPKAVHYRFAALVLIAIALRVLILLSSPAPKIDVFISQTEGARGLLDGQNVYAMEFPSPYAQGGTFDHYGYPPAAFYPALLGWLAFKDIRMGWILCDLLAAFLLFRLARRVNPAPEQARFCGLVTLAFLYFPRTLFVIEQSWTEPLIIVSLAAFALAMASARGAWASGLSLGLWLSSKQYVVVAVPLILKLRRARPLAWIIAIATGAALALPFAVWDFGAMLHDVLGFFLKSEGRPDALSLYGAFLRLGWEMPWPLVTVLWLAGLAWFTRKMVRSLAGWLFTTASVWLFFFMFGKQAFMNYFYAICLTLLLAVAATSQAANDVTSAEEGAAQP